MHLTLLKMNIVNGRHALIKNILDFLFSWLIISYSTVCCTKIWFAIAFADGIKTECFLMGGLFVVLSIACALRVNNQSVLMIFSYTFAIVLPIFLMLVFCVCEVFSSGQHLPALIILILEFLCPVFVLFIRLKYFQL